MQHILHTDLHFLSHTCRANPTGIGFLVRKSMFLQEFHAPSASETQLLERSNGFCPKLVRNCRLQPKTRVFLGNQLYPYTDSPCLVSYWEHSVTLTVCYRYSLIVVLSFI